MRQKTGVKIQRSSAGPYCALNMTAYCASAFKKGKRMNKSC